jgi:hypothetical protein
MMSIPLLSGVLRRFRNYEPVETIEISNNGETLTFDKMRQQEDGIYDKIKNKYYAATEDPVKLIIKRPIKPGNYQVHLLDTMAGVTVKLRRDQSVFFAQCNAGLAGRAIDSQFMKQTFGEQFGLRQKIVYIFVCVAFGYLIGLAF